MKQEILLHSQQQYPHIESMFNLHVLDCGKYSVHGEQIRSARFFLFDHPFLKSLTPDMLYVATPHHERHDEKDIVLVDKDYFIDHISSTTTLLDKKMSQVKQSGADINWQDLHKILESQGLHSISSQLGLTLIASFSEELNPKTQRRLLSP